METNYTEILGGLIIVSGAVLIVYFIARYTYLIKRMLAEKGMLDPENRNRISKMDVAGMIIGVGIGLLISTPLSTLELGEDTLDLLIWGVILICGAAGLIVASRWTR